ncbi:histidine kinase [Cellulophaga sp. HaHa_2_1]|nr:histidine kinase [Cellulophaga sp. HaHa_2_1]
MIKFDSLTENKLLQNILVWLFLFLILMGVVVTDDKLTTVFFILCIFAAAVYINNLLILPYFNKNRIIFLLLFILNSSFFTGVMVYFLIKYSKKIFEWSVFINLYGLLVLVLAFGIALKMARDSINRKHTEREAELMLLKAQLNPHFLFNTLNNLYGLSVLKSDKLPELMLKLSDLLRYSLYDTKDAFVPLVKEITYLENYIALEKIRLENQANITFHLDGVISAEKIAPMLCIIFVENAFKHLGNSDKIKSRVLVSLKLRADKLIFSCENSTDELALDTQKLVQDEKNSGIGLKNVEKRLLLLYPDKHSLVISKNEGLFIVTLTLDLN